MIFLRIRRGKHLTFGDNGEKPNVKGRTHETVNYLSCLFHLCNCICCLMKMMNMLNAWMECSFLLLYVVQIIPIFIMCVFLGLVSWVDSIMVASSSSVRGLETLQCGIRASLQHGPQCSMKTSDRGRVHLYWAQANRDNFKNISNYGKYQMT